MVQHWARMKRQMTGDASFMQIPFSEAVHMIGMRHLQYLFNMRDSPNRVLGPHQMEKFTEEIWEYCTTGNSGQSGKAAVAVSVNPTFLQPTTRKWIVHYYASAFEGYFPLPVEELGAIDDKNGLIVGYCQSELKKLLTAFRKRIDKTMFYFHPCHALTFCYEDEAYKFDLIDTSNLMDHLGPVNLLNAAARKLLSDQSVLMTETSSWTEMGATSVAQYVQEVLCCPLSLIPTLYGLRLIDNIEVGPETFRSVRTTSVAAARLRWKKALPFVGVPLCLSTSLEQSLERLSKACVPNPSINTSDRSGMMVYSPLSLCYVLSDIIHRGGVENPSALVSAAFSFMPPAFRRSLQALQAWMEHRPVWRVDLTIPFTFKERSTFNQLDKGGTPRLRLVLVPKSDFVAVLMTFGDDDTFLSPNSTTYNFIDNFEMTLKVKPSGEIDRAVISFLLEDRSLLQSHSAVLLMEEANLPLLFIGPFSDRNHKVVVFKGPYPWALNSSSASTPPERASEESRRLIGESCQESEGDYSIRFKILSDGSNKPSGISIFLLFYKGI